MADQLRTELPVQALRMALAGGGAATQLSTTPTAAARAGSTDGRNTVGGTTAPASCTETPSADTVSVAPASPIPMVTTTANTLAHRTLMGVTR